MRKKRIKRLAVDIARKTGLKNGVWKLARKVVDGDHFDDRDVPVKFVYHHDGDDSYLIGFMYQGKTFLIDFKRYKIGGVK